jgi:predicted nucleic acid-binding protein
LRPRVFLDSGIFIALLDRGDEWHADARALFAAPPKGWCTSVLVVAETHGWFLHRIGEEATRRFHALLDDLPAFEILPATIEHHQGVRRTLNKLRGTKLTYVDASSLTLIAEHRIATVWSTDRHLGLTGAAVVPK